MDYSEALMRWTRKQNTIVVWWTSVEDDAELSKYPSNFGDKRGWPEYLSKSFNNRIGRSTGARLWVAPPLSQHFNRLDPNLDYTDFMASGGVILMYSDLHLIHGLPGRATWTDLRPVEIPAEQDPRPLRPLAVAAIDPTPPPPPPPEPQYPLLEPTLVEEAPALEEPEAETQSSKESNSMNFEAPPVANKSFLAKVLRNKIKSGFMAFGAFVLLCLLWSSVYTINETERGLLLTGGKLSEVQDPGLHMRVPIIQSVKRLSLQTWTDNFPKLSAYSKDQQPADMRVSVTWTANPSELKTLYRTTLDLDGVTNRFIRPITPTEVENVFGLYSAESLVQDRTAFVLALTNRIKSMVPPFVTVVSIQVEDVNFSDAYEKTIEEKAKAAVAVDTAGKLEERATIDARAHVAKEQAFATAKKNQMIAEAEGITAKGTAEASAIVAKANALKNNPQLIQLIEAERWNGSRATTIFGAATPLVSTDTK
jgi:regulator of protease activity HflC (stomatin/prohibitin superfamily)